MGAFALMNLNLKSTILYRAVVERATLCSEHNWNWFASNGQGADDGILFMHVSLILDYGVREGEAVESINWFKLIYFLKNIENSVG